MNQIKNSVKEGKNNGTIYESKNTHKSIPNHASISNTFEMKNFLLTLILNLNE